LGFGTGFGFGSSFLFFFFLGSDLSSSASALRFLLFLVDSSLLLLLEVLLVDFRAPDPLGLLSTLISLSERSSSLSSPPFSAFSFARAVASLASFFFRAFSCFDLRQPVICSFAWSFIMLRLQCLQMTSSSFCFLGSPLGKAAMVSSSISGRMGDDEPEDTADLVEA
jgi:hypothetical protein